jgi:pimeloyl-ACP methyl ester carboxylesterase
MDMNSYSSDHVDAETVEIRTTIASLPKAAEARRVMNSGAFRDVFLPDAERLREEALSRIMAGELRAPTLIVWGANDPSAPLGIGLELFGIVAETRPESEFHVFNKSGHYAYREHPAEFAELTARFLRAAVEHAAEGVGSR